MMTRPGLDVPITDRFTPVAFNLLSWDSGLAPMNVRIGSGLALNGAVLSATSGGAGGASVNIEDYGALPSSSDNTAAINAALAVVVAAGGGEVVVPPGTFLTDRINITTPGVTFRGIGGPSVAKLKVRVNSNYRILYVTAAGFTSDGIGYDGNSSSILGADQGLIEFNLTTNGRVKNSWFMNSGSDGVVINVSDECMVDSDCYFTAVVTGVYGNTQDNTAAYNNKVLFCRFINLTSSGTGAAIRFAGTAAHPNYGLFILGNFIDSPGLNQAIDLYRGVVDCVVEGNRCRWTNWGVSVSNGFNVSISGNPCRGNANYGIEIADGGENITITNNPIDGKNSSGTAVMGTGILVAVSGAFPTCKNVTVSANPIRNGSASGTSRGVYISGAFQVDVSDNVIDGFLQHICVQDASIVTLEDNLLLSPFAGSNMIYVTSSTVTHNGLKIDGNTFLGDCAAFVTLDFTAVFLTNASIAENTVASGTASVLALRITNASQMTNLSIGTNYSWGSNDPTKAISVEMETVGASYNVRENDKTIICTDAGNYAVTLPSAVNRIGREYNFVKEVGSTNTATITAQAGEFINGSNTYALQVVYKFLTIRSDGTRWFITASN